MSAVMIRCPKSFYMERRLVLIVLSLGETAYIMKDNIKEWIGQSISSLLRIADDRRL